MTFTAAPFEHPEIKQSAAGPLVDVPAGKAREAVALFRESSAAGFSFNGFRGCDQGTADKVIAVAQPRVLLVAGIEGFDYAGIYQGQEVEHVILGYKVPWPDLRKIRSLRGITAVEGPDEIEDIPESIASISLNGIQSEDLVPFSRFKGLRRLRLVQAKKLRSLAGMPESVVDLELVRCDQLTDIGPLSRCALLRICLDCCKKISSLDVLASQHQIQAVLLLNMGKIESLKFARDMPHLQTLQLYKTSVLDGDTTYVTR